MVKISTMICYIEIYDEESKNIINKNTALKMLCNGFICMEGCYWHPDGYLIVSDVIANRIFLIYPNNVIHVLLHQSGGDHIIKTHLSDRIGANGIALNIHKELIICQQGTHSIGKLNNEKKVASLCSSFNGKPFNSPKDVVIKSDNAIYFTDPASGLKNNVLCPSIFQPFSGVYKFAQNEVSLLTNEIKDPSGICFSEDENFLFIGSNHPSQKAIYKYLLHKDGSIEDKSIFAEINTNNLKTDSNNNLFAATNNGVVIFSPKGKKLALIKTPNPAMDIAFGGKEKDILYITTQKGIYYIYLNSAADYKLIVGVQSLYEKITNTVGLLGEKNVA